MSQREIYRILDAAANRGREALRVVEDVARFLDDNEALTTALKETRHRFAAASEKLDRRERLLARDTVGDVGVRVEADDEYRRATLLDVLTANFARLQESARSLEEFSKLIEPQLAREWERIRYDSYTLEKMAYEAASQFDLENAESDKTAQDAPEFENVEPIDDAETVDEFDATDDAESHDQTNEEVAEEREPEPCDAPPSFTPPSFTPSFLFGGSQSKTPRERRQERLAQAKLSVAVDRALSDADADALFRANVDVFQLCADANDEATDEARAAEFLRQWFDAYGATDRAARSKPLLFSREFFVWSDAFDGGVVSRLDWKAIRDEIGDDVLLGASVSNLDDALAAFQSGQEGVLDFLEVGPVFESRTTNEPTGAAFLRAVAEACDGVPPIPVFAFGGVSLENCDEIFDSGFERVLVGSAILDAQDKRAAVLRLKTLF